LCLKHRRRDALLRAEGFQVARYWNNDVLRNPEGVLTDLLDRLALK
jgi:very-short-patch-repair endonuclease